MRIPLDHICVKSGILCPRCRRLIESGQVQPFEVDIMKVLLELEENDPNFRFLRDAVYVKSYTLNGLTVLTLDLHDDVNPQLLIKLARTLSEKIKSKVRVVRRTNDLKLMIAQIIAPARVQGVNMVWSPDGTVQYVVRISRYDAKFLPTKIENIEQLLNMMFNEIFKIKIV